MKKVVVHSDGGCHGNPGPGGWAATLAHGDHLREISGGDPATTNNRMELLAAIEALKTLKEACEVEFHTDSTYLKNGVTSWMATWKRNGWRTTAKKPVKNEDLWRALDEVTRGTGSSGSGSRVTRGRRVTNAATNWPTRRSPRSRPPTPRINSKGS